MAGGAGPRSRARLPSIKDPRLRNTLKLLPPPTVVPPQLIVDEFGEKLIEELDYLQEARNCQDFYDNFAGDPLVKIPKVRRAPTAAGARGGRA